MLTLAQALKIVERYTPDLSVAARTDLLDEKKETRTVGGVSTVLYDPYAAALADLMDPERVKERTQGDVREAYVDVKEVAAYLRGESATLRETWPAGDAVPALPLNTRVTVKGWSR